MSTKAANYLQRFVSSLKACRALPKNIELTRLGPVFMASVFDSLDSDIIAESIFTGMDTDPNVAVLKGLVEMVERKAFQHGAREKLISCQTPRSDGFAAYPHDVVKNTELAARENAFHEAIERYVWASWWDNKNVGQICENVSMKESLTAPERLLRELELISPLREVYQISPSFVGADHARVIIYFAFLDPVGVVSGGACGSKDDLESTKFRAVCELVRHALAVKKIRERNFLPATFYEKRLAYFGLTSEADTAARNRIEAKGIESVVLPELHIDEKISHPMQDIVSVHRCYFKNQPAFVGGELERLCL